MYESFYRLTGNPFRLAPDSNFCFIHPSFEDSRAYLDYALHLGEGFVIFTGRTGTGKTTLIQAFLNKLDLTKVLATKIAVTHSGTLDLLRAVAYAFDIDVQGLDKATVLRCIEQFLIQQSRSGRRVLLIIDEAQGLSRTAIEELRLLADLQNESRFLLQIFLVGQETLLDLMAAPEMEQFQQRVAGTCQLQPLGLLDTRNYMEYRLRRVNWYGDPGFSGAAVQAIYQYSKGVPRHINKLCTRLMLHGMLETKHELDKADVLEVATGLRAEQLAPLEIGECEENRGDSVGDIVGGVALLNKLALEYNEEIPKIKSPRKLRRESGAQTSRARPVVNGSQARPAGHEPVRAHSRYHDLASDLYGQGLRLIQGLLSQVKANDVVTAYSRYHDLASDLFSQRRGLIQALSKRLKVNEPVATIAIGVSALILLLLVFLPGSQDSDIPTSMMISQLDHDYYYDLSIDRRENSGLVVSPSAFDATGSAAELALDEYDSVSPTATMIEPENTAESVAYEQVTPSHTNSSQAEEVATMATVEAVSLSQDPTAEADEKIASTVDSAPPAVQPQLPAVLPEPGVTKDNHTMDKLVAPEETVQLKQSSGDEKAKTTAPDVSREQHITKLLSKAGERLKQDRLLYPKADSAYEYFGRVLLLDPSSEAAFDGLKQITERYLGLARRALDRHDKEKAKRYIERGLRVQPAHLELLALRESLNAPIQVSPPAPPVAIAEVEPEPEPEDFVSRLKALFEGSASGAGSGTESVWEDDDY
jgi:type II secretory pathway predicted ATPase ExeA